MSRKTLAVIGAAIGVAIAHFDLLDYVLPSAEVTKAMPKADAPGVHTDFETGWGQAQKQQLGIDDRWHAMLQLPFGVQTETATVTLMLGSTGTAFGISLGATTDDDILLSLMIVPDPSCDPTAPVTDANLMLGDGQEFNVTTGCVAGDQGFAREYVLRDDQRQQVSDYLVNSEIPTIRFPDFGTIPFVMTGYPEAVQAALDGPRIVPDTDASEPDAVARR